MPIDPGRKMLFDTVQPCLDDLAARVRSSAATATVTCSFGARTLELAPDLREIVLTAVDPTAESAAGHDQLLALALGLQARILGDLEGLAGAGDEDERRGALARLAEAANLGNMFAFDLKIEIDDLTRGGLLTDARRVSAARTDLLTLLTDARRAASGQSPERPSAASPTQPTAAPSLDMEVSFKPPAPAPPPRQEKTAPSPPVAAKPPPRWALPTAIGLLVVLMIVVGLQLSRRVGDLPHLSDVDLASVPGFEEVIHRPPEVVVVVDHAVWHHAPRDARQAAIQAIAEVAAADGYRRAEVRSRTKQGLAFWEAGESPGLGD